MNWRKDIVSSNELKEKIWLRKGLTGWKVVHPIKNEDGSWNWKNLLAGGSWWNLLFVIIIVGVVCLAIVEYVFNINILINELQQCEAFCGIVK